MASNVAQGLEPGVGCDAGALGEAGEVGVTVAQRGHHHRSQGTLRLHDTADVPGLQDLLDPGLRLLGSSGPQVQCQLPGDAAGRAVVEGILATVGEDPGLDSFSLGECSVDQLVLAALDVDCVLRHPGAGVVCGHLVQQGICLGPAEQAGHGDDVDGVLVVPEQVRVAPVAAAREPLWIGVV